MVHTVLDLVHVSNCRLNGWKACRDRRGERWLEETRAEVITSKRKASAKSERHKVTAAATVAV